MQKEYKTITEISGPLVFAEIDEPVGYDEIVEIETPNGSSISANTSGPLISVIVLYSFCIVSTAP